MRLGTSHTYDSALEQLMKRQVEMASQQEKLTSGKRVNRASDDPTGASQAERALTRMSRLESDQRTLSLQTNALTMAESTLGESTNLVQRFRELVVSAGNTSYNTRDRATIAQQLTGLRDQIFSLANKTDSNGIPLFGGLGSASAPFLDATAGVAFQGIPGQRASTQNSVPGAMDGQAIWMKHRSRLDRHGAGRKSWCSYRRQLHDSLHRSRRRHHLQRDQYHHRNHRSNRTTLRVGSGHCL
jgi:flagellar hook-associated protein 3 FlgL